MSFFDSEVVQNEMLEVSKLQEKVYSEVFTFPSMDREAKINHINDLEKLMEKQQILYMRMALSDDSDAIEMKNRIKDSATMMGLPENVDMNALFSNMGRMIQSFKRQLGEEND
jgi:hypothetical protein